MRHFLLALTLVLALAMPTLAQTQADLNAKAAQDFKQADTDLNKTYQALHHLLTPDVAHHLEKSEAAWVAFRDADADAKASENTGGSIYPLVRFDWLRTLTLARTQQLKDWLKEASNR